MWIKRFILCSVFLCSIAQAASDFSGDANCKALWRFENGALTADSKGTNTLTAVNTPAADIVNFKEGAASCDFELSESDCFSIADASLDAGFPLKNGDATKTISVCFWVKFESFADYSNNVIFLKGLSDKYSLWLDTYASDGFPVTSTKFRFRLGYNGGASQEDKLFSTTFVTARWYHVGFTYQDSDKSYKMRIWDDTAGALLGGAEVTGNTTNNINVEDGVVDIASYNDASSFLDGLLDELVIFNDVLTSDEIDEIRAGTYGAAPPAGGGEQVIIIEDED